VGVGDGVEVFARPRLSSGLEVCAGDVEWISQVVADRTGYRFHPESLGGGCGVVSDEEDRSAVVVRLEHLHDVPLIGWRCPRERDGLPGTKSARDVVVERCRRVGESLEHGREGSILVDADLRLEGAVRRRYRRRPLAYLVRTRRVRMRVERHRQSACVAHRRLDRTDGGLRRLVIVYVLLVRA